MHATRKAERSFGRQVVLFCRAADVDEVPRRAFKKDVRGLVSDFRFSAAQPLVGLMTR
jgi:hypothetical protein